MLKTPHTPDVCSRSTFVVDAQQVEVPEWIGNLASFRHWARSDEFPETGRICYLNGETWVDMSKEQVFSHNQAKGEFNRVLSNLAKVERQGRYFGDGVLISHVAANFTSQPDGSFVSFETLKEGRLALVPGAKEGFVELEGTPDMVLEIVSTGSVIKDTRTLRELYWKAGIAEYWLVDARGAQPAFDILRHTAKGYVVTRKAAGWLKSAVFEKTFRLVRAADERGDPEFTLEVK